MKVFRIGFFYISIFVFSTKPMVASEYDRSDESIINNSVEKIHSMKNEHAPYVLYGWKLSYFTGKLFSYLRYKNIHFVEKNIDYFTLNGRIKKETGARVMPVLETSEGVLLQDTLHIIKILEKEFPENPIFPTTPKKMLVSNLIEAWADEFWIPMAMHYRWSKESSVELFMLEAGRSLSPIPIKFVQNFFAKQTAQILINYLPIVGVVPEQHQVIERWTENMLSLLENHFEQNEYLLGSSGPSLGDFGLMGPLYAHLSRDPWPRDNLMIHYPHVMSWIERMLKPHNEKKKLILKESDIDNDQITESLLPIIETIFEEFTAMNEGVLGQLNQTLTYWPEEKLLKRTLSQEKISFPLIGESYFRRSNPHTLYKTQNVLRDFHKLSPQPKKEVKDWAKSLGGEAFLSLNIPQLKRSAVRVMRVLK